MNKFLVVIFFFKLLISLPVYSQVNLVPNPSFESYTSCPNNYKQLYKATSWIQPTRGDPDYYNSCCTNSTVGVPKNNVGFEYAHSGVGYAGFYAYNPAMPDSNYREYIQAKLSTKLKKNKKYLVRFYLSLADGMQYGTPHSIGLYLSDTAISRSDDQPFTYNPQVTSSYITTPIGKNGWTEVKGFYTAIGNEQYITIGNFNDDAHTDTVFIGGGNIGWNFAYYYIDDAFVGLCNNDTAITKTICAWDSVLAQGQYQKQSGIYYDTLQNSNGCDSVLTTNLTV